MKKRKEKTEISKNSIHHVIKRMERQTPSASKIFE